jgi:hypothetical protein
VRVAGKTGTAQKFDQEKGRYSQSRYTALFVGAVPADDPQVVIVVALDEPQGDAHGGGDVAAPLFAKVATAHLASLGIVTKPEPLPWIGPATQVASQAAPLAAPAPSVQTRPPAQRVDISAVTEVQPTAALTARPEPKHALVARTERHRTESVSAHSIPVLTRLGSLLLMPDLVGHSVNEVRRLAAASSLNLRVRGSGQAVEQVPAPGTILDGDSPLVTVHFRPVGEG